MEPRPDPDRDRGRAAGRDAGRAVASTMTFLFTDIEGSTRRWEETADMFELVECHFEVLDEEVGRGGGTVFATLGDGIAAAFRSAHAAVRAAVQAQRRLRALGLDVRMGMHTGEVERADGDFRGRSVNRASRVMSAASGGQILVSDLTASLLRSGAPPAAYRLSDLGSHRLRGLREPERLWQVDAPDLPDRFPPVHAGRPDAVGLPAHRTSLLGRGDDERKICALLERCRVVTLTGVGGVGKTRLAAHVARRMSGDFESTAFVALASIAEPAEVAAAIATALADVDGWTAIDGGSRGAVGESKSTLLVVDNCEHLVESAAQAINDLTERRADLTVLATSREALGIDGEHVVKVRPLTLDAAARLFEQRATAAGADIAGVARTSIEALCRRLDGIPLAIELASARAASLPLDEILGALDASETLCFRSRRPGTDRHVTLEATIAWSYRLLDERERQLFVWLSVFSNGFEFDAARYVADTLALGGGAAVAAVESLVAKSMITVDVSPSGVRYRMLETMRAFASDRLEEAGERPAARRAAARWVAAISGPQPTGLCSAAVERSARRLEREQEAWRDAVALAAETGSSELAGALCGPPADFFLLGRHDLAEVVRPLLDVCRRPVDRRAVLSAMVVSAAGVTSPEQLMAWADEVQSIDDRASNGLGALMRWLAFAWSGRFAEAVDVCVAAADDDRVDSTTRDLLIGIAILDHFSLTDARDDPHGLVARAAQVADRAEMALARVSCRLGLAWAVAGTDPARSLSLVRQGLDDIADVPALTRLTLPGSASRLLSLLDPAVAASALLEQIELASCDSFVEMIPLFYGAALLERVGNPCASPTLATVAALPLTGSASMMDFVDQARRAARRRDEVALDRLERSVRDGLRALSGAGSDVAVARG